MAKNQMTRPLTLPTAVAPYDLDRRPVAAPKNGKGFPRAADAMEFSFSKNVGLKQKS